MNARADAAVLSSNSVLSSVSEKFLLKEDIIL